MVEAQAKFTIGAQGRADMEATYRTLHSAPELSMQEEQTAKLIEAHFVRLEIPFFRCAGTGVVGIQRNGDGPVVAFRADMDGLPISETTGLDYASTQTGTMPDGSVAPIMHACGHDAHMASALAAMAHCAATTSEWTGTIVWIFQPGEETGAGARAMVTDGLWDRVPRPEVIYGQHINAFRTGLVRLAPGAAAAMADSWEVTLHGAQTHASRPHTGLDPVVLGAHVILRIQSLITREVDAKDSTVVTVSTFHAGLKENIIPGEAVLTLNIRSVDEKVRQQVLDGLRRIVSAEALASGAPEPTIRELSSFPPLINDAESAAELSTRFEDEFGDDFERGAWSMASEDFGVLGDSIGVPSVFWRFGCLSDEDLVLQREGEVIPSNHSPRFAPQIEALATGARACVTAIMSRVGS